MSRGGSGRGLKGSDDKDGGLVHVVIGSDGVDQIRAEGRTNAETWRRALDQVGVVVMTRCNRHVD